MLPEAGDIKTRFANRKGHKIYPIKEYCQTMVVFLRVRKRFFLWAAEAGMCIF
jgi:predicted transcriptional regulator with HTH domain